MQITAHWIETAGMTGIACRFLSLTLSRFRRRMQCRNNKKLARRHDGKRAIPIKGNRQLR
jgi:hypothetical protein